MRVKCSRFRAIAGFAREGLQARRHILRPYGELRGDHDHTGVRWRWPDCNAVDRQWRCIPGEHVELLQRVLPVLHLILRRCPQEA